jgi:molybdenum cofactor guanylyltransferase
MTASQPQPLPVSGAVLAGGASRRMGVDKRAVNMGGRPLVHRALLSVGAVCRDVMFVTRFDRPAQPAWFEGVTVRVVHDTLPDGPLAGIEAALSAARYDPVLVVAADMPTLQPALLRLLLRRANRRPQLDALAIATDGHGEPLLAVYRRRVLKPLRALLAGGERRAQELLRAVDVELIPPDVWREADQHGRSLFNVNEPTDLERLTD